MSTKSKGSGGKQGKLPAARKTAVKSASRIIGRDSRTGQFITRGYPGEPLSPGEMKPKKDRKK